MTNSAAGASRSRILITSLAGLLLVLALVAAYLVGVVRSDRADAAATAVSGSTGAVGATGGTAGGAPVGALARVAALTADVPGSSGVAAGITVTGTGTATGTPDTLALDLAVASSAGTVTKALDEANAAAKAVQTSLTAHGVADKDLQTTGLSIQPQYDSKGQSITGYQVTESVQAVIHGLAKAGDTITSAVAAGGNAVRVNSIGLDLGDSGALMSQARGGAFAQAKAKAEQYAKAAGTSLGKVVSITDAAVATASPVFRAGAAASGSISPVPIQAGSKDVSVTVTVVFALA
jgi:uncharacterized protein YggE